VSKGRSPCPQVSPHESLSLNISIVHPYLCDILVSHGTTWLEKAGVKSQGTRLKQGGAE
jgi:hypothetical protein